MASRTTLFPRNENDTLLIPPLVLAYGKVLLDPSYRFDKINRVVIVFFNTGTNG